MATTLASIDRVMTAASRRQPDRVPITPITRDPCMRFAGTTWSECLEDGEKYVRAQLKYLEVFQLDAVWDLGIVPVLDEAFGTSMLLTEDDPPSMMDPAIPEIGDFAKLKPIKDVWAIQRARFLFDIISRLKAEVGRDIPVIAWASPPFRTACMVRGIQNIYLDMYEEPNFVKDLVEFCIEPTVLFARAAIEAGADMIWTSNPTASMTMISREYYEEFVTWSTKRFFDGIREADKNVLFHICGDWHDRVDLVVAEGPAILHIDQMDLAEVKAKHGHEVALMGNVKTTKTLLVKTPADVETETLAILEKGAKGGGFFLAPDCLTPRDTPDANMRAMVEIGRTHGIYSSPDPLATA